MTAEKVTVNRLRIREHARKKGLNSDTEIMEALHPEGTRGRHRKTFEKRCREGWQVEHFEALAELLDVEPDEIRCDDGD